MEGTAGKRMHLQQRRQKTSYYIILCIPPRFSQPSLLFPSDSATLDHPLVLSVVLYHLHHKKILSRELKEKCSSSFLDTFIRGNLNYSGAGMTSEKSHTIVKCIVLTLNGKQRQCKPSTGGGSNIFSCLADLFVIACISFPPSHPLHTQKLTLMESDDIFRW
jgi:hypothetical protein